MRGQFNFKNAMMENNIKNILVVDDNELLVHSIERHLRREGFEVVVAYDARMAKDLVLTAEVVGSPFDVAITDVLMPNMTGFAFVSWLNYKFPQVAVLMMTGFGNQDLINKVLRPEIDFWHRKPVVPQDVMQTLQTINERRFAKSA